MARSAYVLVLTALVLAGCDTDLPRATEVISMRLLGARTEVEGDEARATPEPGERVAMHYATAFPTLGTDVSEMASMFIGCTAPDRFTGGLPICQELIDAALSGATVEGVLPMIDEDDRKQSCRELPVPKFFEQRGTALSIQCSFEQPVATINVPSNFRAKSLLILGVVCERGDPFIEPLEPLLFGCDMVNGVDAGDALRVQGTIAVQQEAADENHNPSLDALTVEREDQPWDPSPPREDLPPERNCEGAVTGDDPALHRVVPGKHRITLSYDADAREEFEGEPEDLEITVYTTIGEMERRFTVFEGSDPGENGRLESELDWDPPTEVPGGGQLVRFFITLRDQRGGFAVTERALCLR
jgi:hypothetical protein